MSDYMLLIFANLTPLASVIAATILAVQQKEGWFVFLLLALFTVQTLS